jgi:hypothetical protein
MEHDFTSYPAEVCTYRENVFIIYTAKGLLQSIPEAW